VPYADEYETQQYVPNGKLAAKYIFYISRMKNKVFFKKKSMLSILVRGMFACEKSLFPLLMRWGP
jgi:hypothetical protein